MIRRSFLASLLALFFKPKVDAKPPLLEDEPMISHEEWLRQWQESMVPLHEVTLLREDGTTFTYLTNMP